jgi:hypothetical protein
MLKREEAIENIKAVIITLGGYEDEFELEMELLKETIGFLES